MGVDYWSEARERWDERADRNTVGYTSAAETEGEHEKRGVAVSSVIADLLGRAGARWGTGLEIGCGDGRLLKHFVTRFAALHGCDLSEKMLAQARQTVPGAVYHVLASEELPVSGLDVVFAYGVFQHVPKEVFRKYVTTAHRALAPGGVLLFNLKRPYTARRKFRALLSLLGWERAKDRTWNNRYYTWRELRGWAAREGFRVAEERIHEWDQFCVWKKPDAAPPPA